MAWLIVAPQLLAYRRDPYDRAAGSCRHPCGRVVARMQKSVLISCRIAQHRRRTAESRHTRFGSTHTQRPSFPSATLGYSRSDVFPYRRSEFQPRWVSSGAADLSRDASALNWFTTAAVTEGVGSDARWRRPELPSSSERSVDGPMIHGHNEIHHIGNLNISVYDYGLLRPRPHRKNCRLRWIDDGGELLHPVHSEIGDGDAAALQVALGEVACVGLLDELLDATGDPARCGVLDAAQYRCDKSLFPRRWPRPRRRRRSVASTGRSTPHWLPVSAYGRRPPPGSPCH